MDAKFLPSEKLFIALISLVAIGFNILPYFYQYKAAPSDKIYVGSYPIIYDKPTYLAEIAQGEGGNWKMVDMYTTEPQKPVFLYPLYLGLGHVARITAISAENVFLAARFIFGIILLFVVLYFIRCFAPNENQRRLAYFLALFASGVGWIFLNPQSLDNWIPDNIPMVRFSYFPHFSVSHILFLLALLLFYRSLKDSSKTLYPVLAGILTFILNFILPFTTIFLYFLVVMLLIISYVKNHPLFKNNFKNALIFFAISLPSLLYMYYLGTHDPVWATVEKQNLLATPPLIRIITGYGLPLLLSVAGLRSLIKKDCFNGLFFSAWIFGAIALAYIPLWIYPMQRRFLETAIYVPIAITASFGLKAIYDYFKKKKIKFFRLKFIFIFLFFITPAILAGNIQSWMFFTYSVQNADDTKLYLPKENIEAMKWLSQNTPSSSVVLASFVNSNNIPYFAGKFVYTGHCPMTINANEKLEKAENFYSNKYSPSEAFVFLKKERINYVFYSDEEKKSEGGKVLGYFDPENYSFLKKVYQNEKVSIYKFKPH